MLKSRKFTIVSDLQFTIMEIIYDNKLFYLREVIND